MPRAGESRTRILRPFLFYLLGNWLLLSQLPREIQGEEVEIFTKCGKELVRFFIRVCGSSLWSEETKKHQNRRSESSAEIMPFSTTKNTENLSTITEFNPTSPQELKTMLDERCPFLEGIQQQDASEDMNLNIKEIKENSFHTVGAGGKSLSESKNIRLVRRFLQRRHAPYQLSYKCCNIGCTKKEVYQFC